MMDVKRVLMTVSYLLQMVRLDFYHFNGPKGTMRRVCKTDEIILLLQTLGKEKVPLVLFSLKGYVGYGLIL